MSGLAQAVPDRATGSSQTSCRLITKLPQPYRVPDAVLAVPSEVTRYGLSQIVNSLLELDTSEPFDFLIKGQLLRSDLQGLLEALQISTESVLEIEYIKAARPPQIVQSNDCEEWITTVGRIAAGYIVSGDYAGMLRFCQGVGPLTAAFRAHKGPITSLSTLQLAAGGNALFTAGKDHVAKAWLAAESKTKGKASGSPAQTAVFRGHTDGVAGVAANQQHVCTASWDTTLRLWPASTQAAAEGAEVAAPRKRQKGSASQQAGQVQEPEAVQVLRGHAYCVSAVDWMPDGSVLSCSHDHSARLWDVETGAAKATTHSGHQGLACAASKHLPGVAAWAGASDAVHLWDVRVPGTSQAALAAELLKFHSHWVTSVAWHPSSPYQLVSASYDKTVKQWDVRASVPLHTLASHTDKVFCATWADDKSIVSGGADSCLRFYSSQP